MSGAHPLSWLRGRARASALLGLGTGAVLLAWALVLPSGAPGAGWLVGLVFWLSIALGAMTLLAIHALTGGRWGDALRPAIEPAAATLPAFLLLFVPLLPSLSSVYPWAADPAAAAHPDVARLYLNPQGFALRGFFVIVGWSVTALLLLVLRRGGLRTLVAALGLTFHFAATTLVSLDWLLSLDPRFESTAFGMAALTTQVLAALAWAAALRPEPAGGRQGGGTGDLAALMMAASLGVLYLGFAQYLVAWYGDLPPKATWFLRRQGWGWGSLQALSVLLSALLPFAALLLPRVRQSPAALARLGPCVLAGLLAHLVWIVAPAFGPAALAAAALGVAAVGGLWVGLACGLLAGRTERPLEAAHGA